MISPPYLKQGDTVGIVSPAGCIDEKYIVNAKKLLEAVGFNVVLGKNVTARENQYAGSTEQRLEDFQNAMDNPDIRAILCSRGGYGSIKILDQLNLKKFMDHPKWVVGFSDITAIHNFLHNHEIESIHAAMPKNYAMDNSEHLAFRSLIDALTGKLETYSFPSNEKNLPGEFEGQIVGGNLSMLVSLRGTEYDIVYHNKILFLEDLNEYLYHIDRMMMNLKNGFLLKNLNGIIAGDFFNMKDGPIPFGKDVYDIVSEYSNMYSLPAVMQFPSGHIENNHALILGRFAGVEVNEDDYVIEYY